MFIRIGRSKKSGKFGVVRMAACCRCAGTGTMYDGSICYHCQGTGIEP